MLNDEIYEQLLGLVLQDSKRPMPQADEVDLVYAIGETPDNQASVLDRVAEFGGKIGLIGYDNTNMGYPGRNFWEPVLNKKGVPLGRIVPIYGSYVEVGGKKTIHTLSEMTAMVRYAKEAGIRSVMQVAPDFHTLRPLMSSIWALRRYYPELRIYSLLGTYLSPDGPSSHSQGTTTGIRSNFWATEKKRIFLYSEQGNLPTPREVFDYIHWRDANPL